MPRLCSRSVRGPQKRAWLFYGRSTLDYGLRAAVLVCCGICCEPGGVAANELRAGVAQADFVLPRGVPLAGYSRRHGKPSTGIHDPVGVRALVVEDDRAAVALVSCDLLIVDDALFDAVRRRVAAAGLPPTLALVVASTHTHSGPGAFGREYLEKISMGHFDPRVFEAIVRSMTEAVTRAYARRVPATMGCRSAATEHLIVNRMVTGGPVDAELTVCGFYPAPTAPPGDHPLAVLVNFAAHPTTLGTWNRQLSADYPGVLMREVERRLPGATCLFFVGSVGDQAPIKSGDGFERAEREGLPLAQRALTLLQGLSRDAAAAVHGREDVMRLPPARVRLGFHLTLPRVLGTRLVDDDATLSVVTIGRTVFFGVPCDLAASLGRELKTAARARGFQPMIIGFANDYIGYCLPASAYEAHAYESLMAFNGPQTGELIVERLIQMLDRMMLGDE